MEGPAPCCTARVSNWGTLFGLDRLARRCPLTRGFCSLIPGLGVKLSNDILAGPTVLTTVGVNPPHDGVGKNFEELGLVDPHATQNNCELSRDHLAEPVALASFASKPSRQIISGRESKRTALQIYTVSRDHILIPFNANTRKIGNVKQSVTNFIGLL